jgi:GH15 family glucan-1,4-alpha-glucosidase
MPPSHTPDPDASATLSRGPADPRVAETSVRIILTHQDASGAYPASPTFSAYQGYSWFRDGAFIADAMRRVGQVESAEAFHAWCTAILLDRAKEVEGLLERAAGGEDVPGREMLPTRFTLEGGNGKDPWWDFQLDGYGTWLWAVAEHAGHVGLGGMAGAPLTSAIDLTMRYLSAFWARPCFDWWEEHDEQVHVSTLGAIRAGLSAVLSCHDLARLVPEETSAAAHNTITRIDATIRERGIANGHLAKWLGGSQVDASLTACLVPYRVPLPGDVGDRTLDWIETDLVKDSGTHRYLGDTFYGGGQWPLLSAFVGWAHAEEGRLERATAYLRWIEAQVTEDGSLPEQVDHHLLAPDRRQEWVERWGPVATPLLWSHAMYLTLASEIAARTEAEQ